MQKILVTGGSGLLGRCVVSELRRHHRVTVLDLLKPQLDVPYIKGDVHDLSRITEILHGFDTIIHLAAIPHPLNDPPENVVRMNVMGTFTVLEAAARCGIEKFVLASSESTLGFAFGHRPVYPLYVPIDEDHPLRPQDPYGMSKVLCEEMCRTYTRRYGMQTLSLRMPWIWVHEPDELELYTRLIEEYPDWYKNLWAFVHGADAAEAFRLAVERPNKEESAVWFITADENWTGRDARDLVKTFYPMTEIRASLPVGPASLITNARAKRELNFHPKRSVRDVFTGEPQK
jgi:UDP-glucose 4-epimerase